MNNIITYLKPVPFFKLLFGTLLILLALFVILTQNILFGFFLMSFGVYLASSEGSQIDLDNNKYRTIWSLFSLHIGKWKPNPEFEYISVFKGKLKQRINTLAASTTLTNEVYMINLFYNRNKHKTFYRTLDKDDAFKVAKHFKLALDIDILDATEREKVWLN